MMIRTSKEHSLFSKLLSKASGIMILWIWSLSIQFSNYISWHMLLCCNGHKKCCFMKCYLLHCRRIGYSIFCKDCKVYDCEDIEDATFKLMIPCFDTPAPATPPPTPSLSLVWHKRWLHHWNFMYCQSLWKDEGCRKLWWHSFVPQWRKEMTW